MHLADWLIIILPMLFVFAVGLYTRRFMKSVADFMAGGRHAGRYLLCTAKAEMTAGAALFVAQLEQFSKGGFALGWWSNIGVPLSLVVAITGFVTYRYRQTRAMTIAQFFEMRYSRKFRLFSGGLAFFAGIVNFGVIPAVGAHFFVYFLELPQTLSLFSHAVPTYLLLMFGFLTISTTMIVAGGQVTVLVIDCIQGMISQLFYVIIGMVLVFGFFSWPRMSAVMLAQPPGHSLVNPFDTFKTQDFNLWSVLMGTMLFIYGSIAWQNQHAFNSSAATPHDSLMGGILGRWRGFAAGAMLSVLAICTLIYLQHPDFSAGAAHVKEIVSQIPDHGTAREMYWPIALGQILPWGIKGMFCSMILMGLISGDGMALHSWGSILIQDLVVPLRKTPLSTKRHLMLLRMAIIGVAIWAFIFGALFPQTEYLLMYWAVTQAIYVGGAGIAIIGGLYWRRGTTAGAWTGLLTGSILSVAGIAARQIDRDFPLNGLQVSFFSSLIGSVLYVAVSLLTCHKPFDMDWLLHRGKYVIESDQAERSTLPMRRSNWLYKVMGINESFTRSDRWITMGIAGWSMFWFVVFAIGSVVYLIHPWSDLAWATYFLVTAIFLPLVLGVITTVWFTIGCTVDMKAFFRRLKMEKGDETDDGTVVHAIANDEPVAIDPVMASSSPRISSKLIER